MSEPLIVLIPNGGKELGDELWPLPNWDLDGSNRGDDLSSIPADGLILCSEGRKRLFLYLIASFDGQCEPTL